MKRHLYLWAYDISCNRSRRQVREILRGYAVGGQKSLFECWLTAAIDGPWRPGMARAEVAV